MLEMYHQMYREKKIVQEKDSNNAVKNVKVSINLRLLLR